MARAHALLESFGLALCDKGRRALNGTVPFGDLLLDVARQTLDYARKELPPDELRFALAELAAMDPAAYAEMLNKIVDGLSRVHSVPFRGPLIDYLTGWPAAIRQVLRRPSDPSGKTAPEGIQFYKPEDILLFLPSRTPRFKVGDRIPGLDDWELTEFRGLGECTEVWIGMSPSQPEHSPAALKFTTDPEAAAQVKAHPEIFQQVFDLNDQAGVVPLRNVYLETDPPCLDAGYVYGYDLTALIYEWKWRHDNAKPEAALKLIKRIATIVGKAHAKKIVHRDLKPSNILIHPTEGGKFTLWVTDFGWGQIQSVRSVELGRGGTPRPEQKRLELRGAHTTLYASPQLTKREAPDPRDDVHAIGVIWYQLLKRDPHAPAPFGTDWADEFRPAGLTDSQVKLLSSCLATRPEKRPADANALVEQLGQVTVAPSTIKPVSLEGALLTPTLPEPPLSGQWKSAGPASGALSSVWAVPHPASGKGSGTLPRLLTTSHGLTFVLIPAGKFLMGSGDKEVGRRPHEGPLHEVTLTKPFYLSVFPITQGQYEAVMGRNPAHFNRAHGGGLEHPVEMVSHTDAVQFCQKLGLLPDEEANGRTYRLPTEAEWEYACRAGSTTPYSCGEKLTPKQAQCISGGVIDRSHGGGKSSPIGQFPPNPWGLYDMHGNVQEWVQDWYDEYYFHDSPKVDPQGPANGTLKVAKGGCWSMYSTDCRSAARRPHAPESPSDTIGFRVVLAVPG